MAETAAVAVAAPFAPSSIQRPATPPRPSSLPFPLFSKGVEFVPKAYERLAASLIDWNIVQVPGQLATDDFCYYGTAVILAIRFCLAS